jgi:hypothetical protein
LFHSCRIPAIEASSPARLAVFVSKDSANCADSFECSEARKPARRRRTGERSESDAGRCQRLTRPCVKAHTRRAHRPPLQLQERAVDSGSSGARQTSRAYPWDIEHAFLGMAERRVRQPCQLREEEYRRRVRPDKTDAESADKGQLECLLFPFPSLFLFFSLFFVPFCLAGHVTPDVASPLVFLATFRSLTYSSVLSLVVMHS